MTPATPLLTRLQQDLNAARKAGDKAAVIVLGTTIADARNHEIQQRRDLTDDDVVDVIRKAIKRRREAIELYLSAKRDDLVAKERSELATLEGYLPAQVDAEEIRAAVRDAIAGGATTIGAVMSRVVPQFKGRAEGSTINAIAREELSRQG
ncbi:MAG TPA: GatB/YqeY domain-containing protein [Gemmatimonadaceae bacterium]|nr:GatB/YqeY domain-containing protein [Gemmatimonadaceae bacterium]